jgi:hypothetical protein
MHPWGAAKQLQLSCARSRSGSIVSFQVEFDDGSIIDIADIQQTDFERDFAQLSALTASAVLKEPQSDSSRDCPGYILDFLATDRR